MNIEHPFRTYMYKKFMHAIVKGISEPYVNRKCISLSDISQNFSFVNFEAIQNVVGGYIYFPPIVSIFHLRSRKIENSSLYHKYVDAANTGLKYTVLFDDALWKLMCWVYLNSY